MASTAQDILQGSDTLDTRPARVLLIKNFGRRDAEVMPAFLNPADLRERIQVEWSKLPVIGLDHEVPHYSRTRSLQFPMAFYYSAYEAARRANGANNSFAQLGSSSNVITREITAASARQTSIGSMDFANFFRSLCFPTKSGLRPPTVHILWPNIFEINGVVTDLSFEYIKFDRSLAPIVYRADVEFLETRVTRRFSEDVRKQGLLPDL